MYYLKTITLFKLIAEEHQLIHIQQEPMIKIGRGHATINLGFVNMYT